ncbi:MAG: hypothetical protein ACR2K3_02415 [Nocardioides sp.]
MTSWRATTPEPVQADLDALVREGLEMARAMLEQSGEFYPFAVVVDDTGEIRLAAADAPDTDLPQSADVLEVLYAGIANDPTGLCGVGFVADVTHGEGSAVQIEAEHRDGGPAIVVTAPYRRKGLLGTKTKFDPLAASEGGRHVWATPPPT